jgi:SagB-type dehydrogenase family enzyme
LTNALDDIWPLAVAVPRRTSDALAFTVQAREVQVRGDPRIVETLIGLCDGRKSLADVLAAMEEVIGPLRDDQRDDMAELAGGLIAHGVLVDCTRAYRVFHWQSSNDSPFLRQLGDKELAVLEAETFAPRAVLDPAVELEPKVTVLERLIERRVSAWPQSGRPATFEELSTLLAAMYRGPRPPLGRRPVPSGGALYPLAIHAAVREPVGALEPGLWWYDPAGSLRLVRSDQLDLDEVIISDPLTDPLVVAGNPVVFISADLERGPRKYGNRGYRWALVEVGAVMQNAYLLAAELGLPIRAIGGFMDQRAREYLDLAGEAWPMLILLLGG